MPKMKTHRSGAKRYKITASGKILRRKAGKGHLLQHKSASRKRKLSSMIEVSATHKKLVLKELPYAKCSGEEISEERKLKKWELNVVMS